MYILKQFCTSVAVRLPRDMCHIIFAVYDTLIERLPSLLLPLTLLWTVELSVKVE